MEIKLKFFVGMLTIFLFIGLFSEIIIERSSAEEQRAEILILGEPTYTLTNKVIKNNRVIGRTYIIDVTFYNSGDARSEELVVNLTDEEGFSLENIIFLNPGETKIISFTWSTIINRDQRVTVNFFPLNLDVDRTQYNSGSKVFTIKIGDGSNLPATSTPGFELIVMIIAIIVFMFFQKKKEWN